MIAVEHELTLRVSPERVWTALTDFAGYAAWHPSLRLGGDLEVGKTFDFGYVNARTGWETGAADAVITMGTVVSALPLSVAGLGTREATVVFSLASLGVEAGPAASFALLWLGNFLVMLGVSLVAFVHHREPGASRDCRPTGVQRGVE